VWDRWAGALNAILLGALFDRPNPKQREDGMSRQSNRQVGVIAFACAAALTVAACSTTNQSTASSSTTVTGSSGQGVIVGGVQTVGTGVVSGVQTVGTGVVNGVTTVGGAVLSPFRPSSYNNWSYTDANGVTHRHDRYGYYDANGAYIAYDNGRGAFCAKWDPATNTCIWWVTG
jgi:hypothetical protein